MLLTHVLYTLSLHVCDVYSDSESPEQHDLLPSPRIDFALKHTATPALQDPTGQRKQWRVLSKKASKKVGAGAVMDSRTHKYKHKYKHKHNRRARTACH